jgi:hypothetical protein
MDAIHQAIKPYLRPDTDWDSTERLSTALFFFTIRH